MPTTGSEIPSGGIILWSGAVNQVPMGWFICDGTNGTPDLRNRFVVGAGDTYAVGGTGGAATHTLTVPEVPSLTVTIPTVNNNSGAGTTNVAVEGQVSANDSIALGTTGGGGAHNNLPPYYALAYIMKS